MCSTSSTTRWPPSACVLLYFDLGGRLSTARALIDFTTVAIGFGSLLWFTALAAGRQR